MESWLEKFVEECKEMEERGIRSKDLLDQGAINYYDTEVQKCKNCSHIGLFWGDDLDYGAFYECAQARYCHSCETVVDSIAGRNFAPYGQKRFLPLMKKKLINNKEFFKEVTRVGKCSECGGSTYRFCKDLGGVDYYDNTWIVCINPNCNWPGEHHEEIESGPY